MTAPATDVTTAVLRQFATAWGAMGAAWGVAPSTAATQGYLLLHGGPLTGAELQAALGLSHRAMRVALADCEAWGIVERAPEPRRSGRRGPAGVAWVAVEDHWEWFRRVAAARKEREADPVVRVLEACLTTAEAAPDEPQLDAIRSRLRTLLAFVRQFDRGLAAVVRTDAAALEHLFGVLGRLDDRTLDKLLAVLAAVPADDLAAAARTLAGTSPRTLARAIRLLGRPGIARLLGGAG
jgi:DNA-binding transcriptional regulator GbsR (MarR family)